MNGKTSSCIALVGCLLAAAMGAGCEEHFTNSVADAGGGDAGEMSQFNGAGVDGPCASTVECRPGLVCNKSVCALPCPADNKCDSKTAKKADDACLLTGECGKGYHCGFLGFCVPSGAGKQYAECTSASDCVKGLFCDMKGISGYCQVTAAAPKDIGAECKTAADCFAGLNCSSPPQAGVPEAEKEPKRCAPGSVTLNPDLFPGVACPVLYEEKVLPFQARVIVPGVALAEIDEELLKTFGKEERARLIENQKVHDFYSTPFPSDLRRKGKKVDLSAHPSPGIGIVGIDLVGNVLDAINKEMEGFSIEPTIFVRFTRPLDPKTIVPAKSSTTKGANVFLVDLKAKAVVESTVAFKASRNKYICANHLAVHPLWSRALKGSNTYGVYVLNTVRADLGEGAAPEDVIPGRGDHLAALLDAKKPGEATMDAAWNSYAPMRAYLKGAKVDVKNVVAATVFTTMDPSRHMRELRAVALAAKKPKFAGPAVLCNGKTKSPCAAIEWDAKKGTDPRDCPKTVSPLYHEIHTRIRLPVYQDGFKEWFDSSKGVATAGAKTTKAPYLSGNGGLALDAKTGKPKVVGYEDVCAAIAIPKGTWTDKSKLSMPASGWPVLLYAHGTGGSHRSGMSQAADAMARLTDPKGKKVATAVISLDQPMHGTRRGPPPLGLLDPGPLFYNFANPPAAKGNLYQGAADSYQMVMFAKIAASANLAGTGKLKFDPNQIYFMGHSQGGTTGPLGLAYEPGIRGMVFSGTGGSLVNSLLNKKSPQDATVGVQIALQEVDLDENHPVLALMQYYFDEVDPLVYGPMYFHDVTLRCGPAGCGKTADPGLPQHMLATFGQGDTYTPPATSRIFSASTRGLMLKSTVKNVNDWFDDGADLKMDTADHTKDIKGNIEAKDKAGKTHATTGAIVQHLNDPAESINCKTQKKDCTAKYDGHFIAFRHYMANKQVTHFLATLQTDAAGVPTVVSK